MDWWRYITKNDCSGIDLDIRELLDSTHFEENIRQVSALESFAAYSAIIQHTDMYVRL